MASKTSPCEAELVSKVTFTGPEQRTPAESLAQAAGLATRSSGRPTRTPGSDVQHGRGRGRNKPQGEPVVILYNEQFCFICSFVKSLENGGMTAWQVGTVLGPAESRSP